MMTTAEEADAYTILLLKKEHGLDVTIPEESKEFNKEDSNCAELYRINSMMWEIEDLISKERDFAKIGLLYLALRYLTGCRVKEKNRISKMYGDTLELKDY